MGATYYDLNARAERLERDKQRLTKLGWTPVDRFTLRVGLEFVPEDLYRVMPNAPTKSCSDTDTWMPTWAQAVIRSALKLKLTPARITCILMDLTTAQRRTFQAAWETDKDVGALRVMGQVLGIPTNPTEPLAS